MRPSLLAAAFICLNASVEAATTEPTPLPPLAIARARGTITVDGQLDDEGWREAPRVETWFETNVGDNVPPPVKNTGWLAYDDRFLYAAFVFEDPEPGKIRAPFADRDNVGSDTDYGGLILDTRNDGRTAVLLLANPRGIQYDAVTDDASGEDSAPDFFWDSAARITEKGWNLEIRVPFSSLRYKTAPTQTWGIMLYRNYPRAYRYQMLTTRVPRGSSCFICNSGKLEGLSGLPSGGHIVVAPYASGSLSATAPEEGPDRLDYGSPTGQIGLDVKWTPNADNALDATVNPDFSQIESDVAQIGANERFALFFPEKRPFFLEGVELLSSTVRVVYTRTITDPRWGARGTGKKGRLAYTGLLAEDSGGGSVILPGPLASDTADQDFRSWVGIGRLRYDLGRSFVSLMLSDREVEGGGHNRVFGPDFRWRPTSKDTVTGQALWSDTVTPERPELADEWDGRTLQGYNAHVFWHHSTRTVDWFTEAREVDDEFRADNGFVPRVGFRQTFGEAGYTFWPKGFLRRLRTFAYADRYTDLDGDVLNRHFGFGSGMDGRWASFFRMWYSFDRIRSGDVVLPRNQLLYILNFSPNRHLSQVALEGNVGEQIDFDNDRTGTGADVNLSVTMRPTNHLDLRFNLGRRWLNVEPEGLDKRRLFTAEVNRLRATYTFTSRTFLRAIAQHVRTRRDPSLYRDEVEATSGSLSGSILFAYKLNWQTVLFVGVGDTRTLEEDDSFRRSDRQLFAKVSYAFQR